MKSEQRQRAEWVDATRFLAMLAVYIGHWGAPAGALGAFVWLFHVPLFFVISGMFATSALDRPFWPTFVRRAKALLIPYAVYGLVYIAVALLVGQVGPKGALGLGVQLLLSIRNQVLPPAIWFLTGLLVVQTAYDAVGRLLRRPGILALAFMGLTVLTAFLFGLPHTPRVPWNLDTAAHYLGYYAVGAWAFPYLQRWFSALPANRRERPVVACLAVLSATAFGLYAGYTRLAVLPQVPGILVLVVVVPLAMSLWAAMLGYVLRNIPSVVEMGRETLFYCGTESTMKNLVPVSLGVLGLKFEPAMPLGVLLVSLGLMLLGHWLFVPLLRRQWPILVGARGK